MQLSKHTAFQESALYLQKRLIAQINFTTSTKTCTTLHNEMALDHFVGTKKLMTAEWSGLLCFTIKIKQRSKELFWTEDYAVSSFWYFWFQTLPNYTCEKQCMSKNCANCYGNIEFELRALNDFK